MLTEDTIFLPRRQPSKIETIPIISEPTNSRGRFIFPSPALTPVTSESAESAIERASASRAEMLFELSVSASAPLKYKDAGLDLQRFFWVIILLKKFCSRLKIPRKINSTDEIISHKFSGTANLIISAKPTDRHRKAVPIALIISEERKGIFIPALPIPTAAAKQSVQTAAISNNVLIATTSIWQRYYSL